MAEIHEKVVAIAEIIPKKVVAMAEIIILKKGGRCSWKINPKKGGRNGWKPSKRWPQWLKFVKKVVAMAEVPKKKVVAIMAEIQLEA